MRLAIYLILLSVMAAISYQVGKNEIISESYSEIERINKSIIPIMKKLKLSNEKYKKIILTCSDMIRNGQCLQRRELIRTGI